MSWNWNTELRKAALVFPHIMTAAVARRAVRFIYTPGPGPNLRVLAHVPSPLPLPSPHALNVPGLPTVRMRYAPGKPLEVRSATHTVELFSLTAPKCRAGSPVRQESDAGDKGVFGTAGWNFQMGSDAYLLSNRHVLRSLAIDEGPIAHLTSAQQPAVADLHSYEELDPATLNHWDLAIAKYRDPSTASAAFADVPSTAQPGSYPRAIATNLEDDAEVYKVGTSSMRTSGTLVGMGYELKCDAMGDGTDLIFAQQMYFELEARGGDSGSVIVRRSDHALVGLLMGIVPNTKLAAANPLINYGLSITAAGSGTTLPTVTFKPGTVSGHRIEV